MHRESTFTSGSEAAIYYIYKNPYSAQERKNEIKKEWRFIQSNVEKITSSFLYEMRIYEYYDALKKRFCDLWKKNSYKTEKNNKLSVVRAILNTFTAI